MARLFKKIFRFLSCFSIWIPVINLFMQTLAWQMGCSDYSPCASEHTLPFLAQWTSLSSLLLGCCYSPCKSKILSTSVYSMQKCRDVKTWDRSNPAPDKQSVISIGNKTTWVRLQRSLSLPSFIFPAHSIQTWLLCESALKRTIETLAVNWNFCRNLFILIKKPSDLPPGN